MTVFKFVEALKGSDGPNNTAEFPATSVFCIWSPRSFLPFKFEIRRLLKSIFLDVGENGMIQLALQKNRINFFICRKQLPTLAETSIDMK